MTDTYKKMIALKSFLAFENFVQKEKFLLQNLVFTEAEICMSFLHKSGRIQIASCKNECTLSNSHYENSYSTLNKGLGLFLSKR